MQIDWCFFVSFSNPITGLSPRSRESCGTVWVDKPIGIAMENRRIESLRGNSSLWVWDGTWLPAKLIETPLESATGILLVRFSHGVSAPVPISHVAVRDPALHGADRPSISISAMMYAQSLRSDALPTSETKHSSSDDRRAAGSIFENAFPPMAPDPASARSPGLTPHQLAIRCRPQPHLRQPFGSRGCLAPNRPHAFNRGLEWK